MQSTTYRLTCRSTVVLARTINLSISRDGVRLGRFQVSRFAGVFRSSRLRKTVTLPTICRKSRRAAH